MRQTAIPGGRCNRGPPGGWTRARRGGKSGGHQPGPPGCGGLGPRVAVASLSAEALMSTRPLLTQPQFPFHRRGLRRVQLCRKVFGIGSGPFGDQGRRADTPDHQHISPSSHWQAQLRQELARISVPEPFSGVPATLAQRLRNKRLKDLDPLPACSTNRDAGH